MSNITAKKLLEIAAAEIGYCEKETNSQLDDKTANAGDANYTKYARDLRAAGYYNGNKQGYAWCDMFVDWCFYKLAGNAQKAQEIICQTGDCGAGCLYSAQYYKAQNRFYTSNPQPGDQIFFGRGSAYEHTGIVEKVVGNVVHTIEGNTSNKVARRTYSLSSTYIKGYGRPKFETAADAVVPVPAVPVAGKISTGSEADARAMWNFFKSKGLNDYGTAGLMANLDRESGLRSDNLQNTYERKLGFTDSEYVEAVDNGTYTNFVRDAAGFGLAQWTHWSRKQALLEYAKAQKKSIADWEMQCEHVMNELNTNFKGVLKVLQNAKSIIEASNAVLMKYEAPADQGTSVQMTRARYAQKYYDKYAGKVADTATEPVEPAVSVEVGDIVDFIGSKHYVSANASKGLSCRPGKARVSKIYQPGKAKHPYHLVKISGGGSTVHGWVDASDISGAADTGTIKKGSTVRVKNGARTYTGGNLAAFVYKRNHKVQSINGDRAVISYGGVTVAAVHLSDLILVG